MIGLLRRPFPSLPVAVAIGIGVQLAAGVLLWGAHRIAPTVPGVDLVAIGVAYGAVLALGVRVTGHPVGEVLALRPVGGRVIAGTVVAALGWAVVIGTVSSVVKLVHPMPADEALRLRSSYGATLGVITVVRLIGIAPLTEELLVRGLFLHGLRPRHGDRWAVVLAAVVFAALHGTVWLAIPAVVGGLVFGSWVVATGSIVPALLGHALSNATAVVRLYGIPGVDAFPPHGVGEASVQPWPVLVLAVALVAAGEWLLRRNPRPDPDRV